jgi:predicted adenylyl cyclase CyaB
MSRNIEIKARIENVDALATRIAAIADGGPIEIRQDDTFFACERGRVKLREFSPTQGELIFYQRKNRKEPKESFYIISPMPEPSSLREALTLAYGQTGRVRKNRTVYLVGRTRVHLDTVEGLGDFVELEVVLSEEEHAQAGIEEARRLMAFLGIDPTQLVDGAYVDLLGAKPRHTVS